MAKQYLHGKFIQDVIDGISSDKEIHDYIDTWRYTKNIDCEVYDFLGMTRDEYNGWLSDESYLSHIIKQRQKTQTDH